MKMESSAEISSLDTKNVVPKGYKSDNVPKDKVSNAKDFQYT